MTRQFKNKTRALILLTVFSLNTVAGFACSIGIDLVYNRHHHEHGEKHSQTHSKGEHKHLKLDRLDAKSKISDAKDDCCSNDVTKFALLDKSVVANNLHLEIPVFQLAFTITFFSQTIDESGLAVNSKFQFVRRSSFLNDTDLQTAIRRFQI